MNALAMSLLLFVLQSQAPNPAAPLVGTWSVSAPAPLPPEDRAIWAPIFHNRPRGREGHGDDGP